jgi:hypothetical protein
LLRNYFGPVFICHFAFRLSAILKIIKWGEKLAGRRVSPDFGWRRLREEFRRIHFEGWRRNRKATLCLGGARTGGNAVRFSLSYGSTG